MAKENLKQKYILVTGRKRN